MVWSLLFAGITTVATVLISWPIAKLLTQCSRRLAVIVSTLIAVPIFKRAWRALATERRLNVDLLDGLAIVAAIGTGDVITAAGIVWLVTVGDCIRDLTQARARRAIRDLLGYQRDVAWVIRGETKVEVPVAELCVGDVVVVYTGSVIPVDGTVVHGEAVVEDEDTTLVDLRPWREVATKATAGSRRERLQDELTLGV